MKLRRLELQNITHHQKLDWTFPDGLVGVYGPNGSGKSSALDAAYTAITADYRRHQEGQAGWLSRGARSGRIVVTTEIQGQQYRHGLELSARGTSSQWVEYTDQGSPVRIAGARQVAEFVRDQLGLDARQLDLFCFIGQERLGEFLQLKTASDRNKLLARLCGTEHAEVVWDALGKRAAELNTLLANIHIDVDTARRTWRVAKRRLRQLREQRAELLGKFSFSIRW